MNKENSKEQIVHKAEMIRADLNNPLDFIEDGSIDTVLLSLPS